MLSYEEKINEIKKCFQEKADISAENLINALMTEYRDDAYVQYLIAKILYDYKKFLKTITILNKIRFHLYRKINREGFFLVEQLLALSWYNMGKNKEASLCFKKASEYAETLLDKSRMYSNYLFISNYFPDITDKELYNRHIAYEEIFRSVKMYSHSKERKNKIRIGYISPDFREHVVVYFSYQLLARYDKQRFEVICYSKGLVDELTEQLKLKVDLWRDIRTLSDKDTAAMIYADKIDILFDLSGHSSNNCLPVLAQKPAPVQICGIGYFNTTGLSAVDYFLTDEYCDPVGENDDLFTEKLLRLPHSHFCYTPPDTVFVYKTEKNLRQKIVFGSFNNFSKITDDVLIVWLQILNRVHGSKLLLKSPHFDKKGAEDDLYKRALKIGFSKAQLEIRGATLPYLNEYADVDIALDPFPYPGGGTTCEALFMGCPLITLKGERHGARFGYSILKNIGLEELAADTKKKYIEIAVGLANDKELLKGLQKNIRLMMQKSYLMDSENYILEIETAYEKIWDKWIAD